ncbi:hypothetical protein C8A01DRAFT_43765 [Parachaetomium inaequale]|uniref:Uncharacterized protein n=1 Tax=Parachaetomium inaequale TaxID=2588326 RepID=A0AAN6PLZ9_9PEZI|nr:hypothetical protein C8A01DRAFT_43765 [Parachaetomium inaequale]
MSTAPDFNDLPDQASLGTSRSRLSIVATLRRRTSRLLGRKGTAAASTADNTPQLIQPESVKSKRSWFHSVGARFHRHDHTLLESSESSQGIQVEMEETSRTNTNPPSSPEISPSPSPTRRRLFRGRHLRLHSLPAKFRRRGAALFSRSSSLSDEDKENFFTLPARPVHASNTGSWSSFRSGVQRAVRARARNSRWQLPFLRRP